MKILIVTCFRKDEIEIPASQSNIKSDIISIPENKGLFGTSYTIFSKLLTKTFGKKYDIIVVDAYGLIGTLTLFLGRLVRIPVVCRVVGDRWTEQKSDIIPTLIDNRKYTSAIIRVLTYTITVHILFKYVDGFIAVSDHIKERIVAETGINSDLVEVIPVPVNTKKYKPLDKSIGEKPNVLTVTNLDYRLKFNGIIETIESIRSMLRRGEIKYKIAGSGKYQRELEEYIDSLPQDIRNNICYLGYVDDVRTLYNQADIVTYKSYIDGCPNVILEAQSCGIPVITNDAVGMKEQITNGDNGFLVESSDELVAILKEIIDSPTLADQIRRNARVKIEKENSYEAISVKFTKSLNNLYYYLYT